MPRPLVAVLLGTDHHPFDRLVGWAAGLAGDSAQDWFVQHGSTRLPNGLPGAMMLSSEDLDALLRRADAVITHGGPGLIMEARWTGHVPVVVPRDPRFGEHVDGHQLRFVSHIEHTGLVHTARTPFELTAALHQTLHQVKQSGALDPSDHGAADRFGRLVEQGVRRL